MIYMILTINEARAAALENVDELPVQAAAKVNKFNSRARRVSQNGTKRAYISNMKDGDKAELDDMLGSDYDILGAWQRNGLQIGLSYNEDGDIVGTPDYPINTALLKTMAPDVYDDEVKLPPPSTAEEALKRYGVIFGQAPRKI